MPTAGAWRIGSGPHLELLQGHLCGVFLGVVDVLAIVPVARRYALAFDGHRAGPRRTAA